MTINVSQQDIDNSALNHCCPITLALRRALGKNDLSVSRNYIRIKKKRIPKDGYNIWTLIELPKVVREFTLSLYNIPFQFQLSPSAVKKIAGKEISKNRNKHYD